MKSMWSGALSFGLIHIPVNLYSGTNERRIDLDMLHKKDLSPIRFARICKAEEKEIPYSEIVKGYEFDKGEYVVVTEEDFIKVSPKKQKTLEIQYFIKESEVDSTYFDVPYFLEPGKGAAKTYVLLNEALQKSKKVGVVSYVLHTRSHIGLIKPHGRGLLLQQLRFHSELRNFSELELPVAKIQPKELEFALKLIEQLTESFRPEQFKDTYTEELKAIIEAKIKGVKPHRKKSAEKKAAPAVGDIMQQLKESLSKYGSRVTRKSPKPRKKVKK
jgi:DNA end-binding protein Ku